MPDKISLAPLALNSAINFAFGSACACTGIVRLINQNPITPTNLIAHAVANNNLNAVSVDQSKISTEPRRITPVTDNPNTFVRGASPEDQRVESMFITPNPVDRLVDHTISFIDGDEEVFLPSTSNRVVLSKGSLISKTPVNDQRFSGTVKRKFNDDDWLIDISFALITKDLQIVSPTYVEGINYFSSLNRAFEISGYRTWVHGIRKVVMESIIWTQPQGATGKQNILQCNIRLLSDMTEEIPNLEGFSG